jgi:hypothetical protein
MVSAAFQLTIVFSIIPVIPWAVALIQQRYGIAGATGMMVMWYLLYPLGFGALMWVSLSRMEAVARGGNRDA